MHFETVHLDNCVVEKMLQELFSGFRGKAKENFNSDCLTKMMSYLITVLMNQTILPFLCICFIVVWQNKEVNNLWKSLVDITFVRETWENCVTSDLCSLFYILLLNVIKLPGEKIQAKVHPSASKKLKCA